MSPTRLENWAERRPSSEPRRTYSLLVSSVCIELWCSLRERVGELILAEVVRALCSISNHTMVVGYGKYLALKETKLVVQRIRSMLRKDPSQKKACQVGVDDVSLHDKTFYGDSSI